MQPSFRSSADRLGWAVLGERDLDGEVILYEGCHEALEPYETPRELSVGAPVFEADAAVRVAELEVGLRELQDAQFATWVTNQQPVDDTWDAYVEQARMLGLDEYIQLYQDAVDAQAQTS